MKMTRQKLDKFREELRKLLAWSVTYRHLESLTSVHDLGVMACDDLEKLLQREENRDAA